MNIFLLLFIAVYFLIVRLLAEPPGTDDAIRVVGGRHVTMLPKEVLDALSEDVDSGPEKFAAEAVYGRKLMGIALVDDRVPHPVELDPPPADDPVRTLTRRPGLDRRSF